MLKFTPGLTSLMLLVSLTANAGARFLDGSREVHDFPTLESILSAASPWLSARELEAVLSFILQNGLTLPSAGGAGLIHRSRVEGVSPEEASPFLQGPATGEEGYAPNFRAENPPSDQVRPGITLARSA